MADWTINKAEAAILEQETARIGISVTRLFRGGRDRWSVAARKAISLRLRGELKLSMPKIARILRLDYSSVAYYFRKGNPAGWYRPPRGLCAVCKQNKPTTDSDLCWCCQQELRTA